MKKSICAVALAAVAGHSAASLTVTEAYTGLAGEDGTADWFEVTNTGASNIDTGVYLYDDSSADIFEAVALPSLMLAPGESAIILLEGAASDDVTFPGATGALDEFDAIWGAGITRGLTIGDGAGLGNGGSDTVNLFLGGSVVESFTYQTPQAGLLQTIEDGPNAIRNSVLGENGAFESASFFNDNLNLPNDTATLVGSPGFSNIPAPAALAVLGVGALAGVRRRR
ncbi:MAG: hypothetical protein AAGK04_07505 [Planctomycetota bacterium]